MEELIASLGIGALLPVAVDFLKKHIKIKGEPIRGKHALTIIAIVIGILATGYNMIIPEAFKLQVELFASSTIGFAVLVYEWFIRNGGAVE